MSVKMTSVRTQTYLCQVALHEPDGFLASQKLVQTQTEAYAWSSSNLELEWEFPTQTRTLSEVQNIAHILSMFIQDKRSLPARQNIKGG